MWRISFYLLISYVSLVCELVHSQVEYRPNREYRSLNTESYEIAIQKNGEVDVNLASGESVFVDAFPMVWFEGEAAPKPMTTDGSWSSRFPISDPLGDGNGMVLRKKECTWSLRTYPTKPFFAVQVVFENTTKRTVTIRALSPWCVGEPRKGALNLGVNTENAIIRYSAIALPILGTNAERIGSRNLALFNAAPNRMLVAGFLTNRASAARFDVQVMNPGKSAGFDRFRAFGRFQPAVELQPGEFLESDVFYLGVFDRHPVIALERFARAVQAANEIVLEGTQPAHIWLNGDAAATSVSAGDFNLRRRPAAPMDLFESDTPNVWMWSSGDSRLPSIVSVRNPTDKEVDRIISLDFRGTPVLSLYDVFDLRHRTYTGVASNSVRVNLSPRETREFSVVAQSDHPRVLAVSPHGGDLRKADWDGSALTLNLGNDSGKPQTLYVRVPGAYAFVDAASESAEVTSQQHVQLVESVISPHDPGEMKVVMRFTRHE